MGEEVGRKQEGGMVWTRPFIQPEEEEMGLTFSASPSPQPPGFGFLQLLPKVISAKDAEALLPAAPACFKVEKELVRRLSLMGTPLVPSWGLFPQA